MCQQCQEIAAPPFVMSMYASKEDLYKAKAEYYESVNEALKDARGMLQTLVAKLSAESAEKDEQIKLLMGILWRAA